jgi:3-hydroxyacyl-CoA dehydrogenase
VLIECTVEDAGEKKALLRALEPAITSGTLVVSNSSSIIPREIGPHCMGFHCFYPLEMTRFVEIVVPDDCPAARREALLAFAAGSGLEYLEEDESGAFIVNRLLLPIHAECFRLLISGVAPAVVDAATVSTLASVGQLTLMDAIGLDLLHVSAGNYLRRMPEQEVWTYRPLVDGLERLLAVDKRGSRNGDGLLSGAPTPWPITVSEDGQAALAKRFLYLLVNTCYDVLGRNTITDRGLALALDALLAPEQTVSQVVETEGRDAIRAALERLHCDTGLPYFRPSGGLTAPVQGSAGAQAPRA